MNATDFFKKLMTEQTAKSFILEDGRMQFEWADGTIAIYALEQVQKLKPKDSFVWVDCEGAKHPIAES